MANAAARCCGLVADEAMSKQKRTRLRMSRLHQARKGSLRQTPPRRRQNIAHVICCLRKEGKDDEIIGTMAIAQLSVIQNIKRRKSQPSVSTLNPAKKDFEETPAQSLQYRPARTQFVENIQCPFVTAREDIYQNKTTSTTAPTMKPTRSDPLAQPQME